MSEHKPFWIVCDEYTSEHCDSWKEAVEEIGGWSAEARILRINLAAATIAEDVTEELALNWFEFESEVDDEPAEAFAVYVKDKVIERRNAAEDPDGCWAKADAWYDNR